MLWNNMAGDPATACPILSPLFPKCGIRLIQSRIAGARLTVLQAAHISNVEQPAAFADAVLGFLARRAA
jgi:pimeloyl-ACP methyl ester carboxylesterase